MKNLTTKILGMFITIDKMPLSNARANNMRKNLMQKLDKFFEPMEFPLDVEKEISLIFDEVIHEAPKKSFWELLFGTWFGHKSELKTISSYSELSKRKKNLYTKFLTINRTIKREENFNKEAFSKMLKLRTQISSIDISSQAAPAQLAMMESAINVMQSLVFKNDSPEDGFLRFELENLRLKLIVRSKGIYLKWGKNPSEKHKPILVELEKLIKFLNALEYDSPSAKTRLKIAEDSYNIIAWALEASPDQLELFPIKFEPLPSEFETSHPLMSEDESDESEQYKSIEDAQKNSN